MKKINLKLNISKDELREKLDIKDPIIESGIDVAEKLNDLKNVLNFEVLTNIPDFIQHKDMPNAGGGQNIEIRNAGALVSSLVTNLDFSTGLSAVYSKNGKVTITSTASGGITSINTDATLLQTLTTGSTGTDFAIVDNGTGDHKFNLPTASATNTGKLSSTDWSTFNNKGSGTVTSVGLSSPNSTLTIGNTPVTTSGTITGDINLTHANVWTGKQTFNTIAPTFGTTTAGQVMYPGTAGILSGDTQFIYDSTNHFLALGHTATPAGSFDGVVPADELTPGLRLRQSNVPTVRWFEILEANSGGNVAFQFHINEGGTDKWPQWFDTLGNTGTGRYSALNGGQLANLDLFNVIKTTNLSSAYNGIVITDPATPRVVVQMTNSSTPNSAVGDAVQILHMESTGDLGLVSRKSATSSIRFFTGTGTTVPEAGRFDSSQNFGVGLTSGISARIHAIKTTEQLRLGYDASNYYSTTVSSIGGVTFDAVGTGASFTFSDRVINSSGENHKVRVVTVAGAVTVATTDYIVIVNKGTGAATVANLPATPSVGDTYVIKDGKGDAGANNITITPNAGNIDGAGTYIMNTNYQSITVVYNGTQWNII